MDIFTEQLDPLSWAALGATAFAWGFLAWAIGGVVLSRRRATSVDPLEEKRVESLREGNATYRLFEPLIVELARIVRGAMSPEQRERDALDLLVAKARLPWMPEEYLATKLTESLLFVLVCFAGASIFFNVLLAALIGVIVGLVNYAVAAYGLPSAAAARRSAFQHRLPYAIDVLALLLEAGANFQDAVRVVAKENLGHPLGEELNRVVQQLALGRTRREALMALKERMKDEDTGDLVFAICKGEELGTPLSAILKTQSDQMRLKRTQWGEKAAKEAEVKMTGPNLLIMLACVIVILGPILLPVVFGGGFGL
ncbi:MAG: type II secretion system F family protein [Pirellulaceae bacterium]